GCPLQPSPRRVCVIVFKEGTPMIRALDSDEIERVLRAGTVGRIGCHVGVRTYVVPVAYAYKDGAIYAHSAGGQKIEMMRADPRVCFEVDHVEDLVNWSSAICWGTYEELHDEQAQAALELIRARLAASLPRRFGHDELVAEEPIAVRGDNVVV